MTVNRPKLLVTCAAMVAAVAGTSAHLLAQQHTSEARIRDLVLRQRRSILLHYHFRLGLGIGIGGRGRDHRPFHGANRIGLRAASLELHQR